MFKMHFRPFLRLFGENQNLDEKRGYLPSFFFFLDISGGKIQFLSNSIISQKIMKMFSNIGCVPIDCKSSFTWY